jgi:hypothetical protein
MTIDLSQKEQQNIGRLGKQINSGLIPVQEVRDLINGLQRKLETTSADTMKRNPKKLDRKDKYRIKLKMSR